MLHIILLILKIAGIILLAVIGILLLLMCIILFVPIRYKADGTYIEKKLKGTAKISWLFSIISASVEYEENVNFYIKIFGIKLRQRKKKPKAEDYEPDEDETISEASEEKIINDADTIITAQSLSDTAEDADDNIDNQDTVKSKHKVKRGLHLKKRIHRIKNKLLCAKQKFCDKIKNIGDKKDEIKQFLTDDSNKRTLKLLLRYLKKLVKHILPRKIMGYIKFGFDDPYVTGQVLSYASIFYGIYHKRLKLIPVFDDSVIEADLKLKGHIRLCVVLYCALRVYINKNFRKILKKFI